MKLRRVEHICVAAGSMLTANNMQPLRETWRTGRGADPSVTRTAGIELAKGGQ